MVKKLFLVEKGLHSTGLKYSFAAAAIDSPSCQLAGCGGFEFHGLLP